MMKRFAVILAAICICLGAVAQDRELNALADVVRSLQSGGERAYRAAVSRLAKDALWTPMDELGYDRAVECRASERVPGFKLNSVLTNAENTNRYQTTTADHLNGADSRFNYSLFEKTLKAGKTAAFSLPERWGEQVLLIIPYTGKKARISARASSGGRAFTATPYGAGGIRLSGKAAKGSMLKLSVTNQSGESVSYVIINCNSRK